MSLIHVAFPPSKPSCSQMVVQGGVLDTLIVKVKVKGSVE